MPAPSTTTTNPSPLPPRFQIRQLGPEHLQWTKAIVAHANLLNSPVWPAVYPTAIPARCLAVFRGVDYLVRHQIESGMSFGVFDTQWVYRRAESASTGGALYWDVDVDGDGDGDGDGSKGTNSTMAELLAQMDFPLVSVALSFDAFDALDMARLQPLFDALPLFPQLGAAFKARERREDAAGGGLAMPRATARGEVLQRNSTCTRADYERLGLMKGLAHWVMREAAGRGYRRIEIDPMHDAVVHVWMNPPPPFRAAKVCEVSIREFGEVVGGEVVRFEHVDQVCPRVCVVLQ
ncbi:hypothetical protein GX51_03825 [Blastomyces parvus]|uniref:N-acetyltransferase domain-containing protein n=1 Tax=Blastomyces parvus TaxID=2060905 RepID=A0A2B7X506_9EURO|nr:hypothetical protein GX51_03825 [Blastomyces parvus]